MLDGMAKKINFKKKRNGIQFRTRDCRVLFPPDPHDNEKWICWTENTSREAHFIEGSPTLSEELDFF